MRHTRAREGPAGRWRWAKFEVARSRAGHVRPALARTPKVEWRPDEAGETICGGRRAHACAHVAGICARIVRHPIDITVRHVLFDFRNEYKGFADCFSKLSKEGTLLRGLASPPLFLRPALLLFVYGEAKGLLGYRY